VRQVTGQPATAVSRQRVEVKQPPLLFKLNDLLAEASSQFGFPADRTQSIARSLYEKKLTTYPRTESQHLRPEDDVEMVRERLQQIATAVPALAGPAADALARGVDPANKRVFDSAKVGDHFAIVPAEITSERPELTEGEQKIYDLVAKRFVAAFLSPSETTVHTLVFTVAGETFRAAIQALTEELVQKTVASPVDLVLQELPEICMPATNQLFVELLQDYATADGSVRIPKIIRGRHLLPHELHTLLTAGVVGPLDGFVSQKTRKTYPACIRWIAETHRYEVFFSDDEDTPSADQPAIGACPHCGGAVHERAMRYTCANATSAESTCNFRVQKLWCGRTISRDEVSQLIATGRTELLEGFRGKSGRPFTASLIVGPDGKVAFEFGNAPTRRTPRRSSRRRS
jgi:hypothetical protein